MPLNGHVLRDRYRLVSEIGQGGMGVVYRAYDPVLERAVAVKTIPPQLWSERARRRFEKEARVVAQMDHPGIVPIHDFGEVDGTLYLVMPLLAGRTLRRRIDDRDLAHGDVLDLGIQVAEALDYSHERGIVHRDVKPENVMIEREGARLRARIMDFGLARDVATHTDSKSGIRGTLAYLSPEQVDGRVVDARADLWSLGAVLWECFSGRPPFSGPGHSIFVRIVSDPPDDSRLGVDEELRRVLLRCLAKEPAERFQTGADLASTLLACWSSMPRRSRSRTLATRRETSGPLPPLVGRDRELRQVDHAIAAAIGGECRVLLVGGEAGSGKTRLLTEIEQRAEAQGFRILRGTFAGPDDAFPYQGYAEAVLSWFSGDPAGSSHTLPEFGDLAPDLLAILPALADVEVFARAAERAGSDGRIGAGRPPESPTEVYELLARTFLRLAGHRPLALLLEGVHRGDVSVDALHYIVRRLGSTPTLLVATFTSTEVGRGDPVHRFRRAFQDDSRFSEIHLGPLDRRAIRTFLELQLGSRAIEEDLVRRFARASGGHPSFCRELLTTLQEAGSLARTGEGAWGLTADAALSADAMPATIQQAVERRIERLGETEREVLTRAAVLGRSFDYRTLEDLVPDDVDLDATAESLLVSGFLVEESERPREDLLAFSSTMVRDRLLADLSRRRRRALHRRAGEVLEARHADGPDRVLPQLLTQFAEADVPAKTVRYGLELARASIRARSPEDALRAARIALELVDDPEARTLGGVEGELHELCALAHRLTGSYASSLREAERALAAAERDGLADLAERVLLLAAETAWQARRIEDLRVWLDRGLGPFREVERPTRHRLLTLAATLATLGGDHSRAQRLLEEAEKESPVRSVTPPVAPRGGTLRLVLPSPIHSVRPGELRTTEEIEIAATVHETLLGSDPDGNLHGVLCRQWEMLDGGRSFALDLEEGLRFSDGAPLDAAAVRDSFEQAARRHASVRVGALRALRGIEEFLSGETDHVAGLELDSARPHRLRVHLREALPIFPALLTDPNTAVARTPDGNDTSVPLVGTGPFRLADGASETPCRPGHHVLERNPCFRTPGLPRLDRICLRTDLDAASIARDLEQGDLDLGRDLSPADVDEVLRDPRFHRGLVETTRRNVYFALARVGGGRLVRREVREALFRSIDTRDLVWRTLGRFAHPAVCFVPPGVLGHEAGRRIRVLDHAAASALLETAGPERPSRVRAVVHPVLLDRYGALTREIFGAWASLGVEVEVVAHDVKTLLEAQEHCAELDLWIGRWNADYDDPDDFTFRLFHSRVGIFRRWFSSPDSDRLVERARRETGPSSRQALYRDFEDHLAEDHVLVPLFHDVDYRIAGPRVRGLAMRPSPPWVDYAHLGVVEAEDPARAQPLPTPTRRSITVPIPVRLDSLDPADGNILELCEVTPNVYETLMRIEEGGRVVPWLAEELRSEAGGLRYRIRLRPDTRFHDGRRVTARDVRWSFERLLLSPARDLHFLLLPLRGAIDLRDGRAPTLGGVRILSSTELELELERPLAFFPTLLTHPATGILPERARFERNPSGRSAQVPVGTGPFRVVDFRPGRRIELERHGTHWRDTTPGVDRLVFELGCSPDEIRDGFREGRFALASDLRPEDAERLLRDARFAAGYREAPRLATYFLALNARTGLFSERKWRRALIAALDRDALLLDDLGRTVLPAAGLIPPGVPGHGSGPPEWSGESWPTLAASFDRKARRPLRIAALPIYPGAYARLWARLQAALGGLSFDLEIVSEGPTADVIRLAREGSVDLIAHRWVADYPDADSFVTSLVHSRDGLLQGLLRSETLDRLAEEGRRETDPARREVVYRGIEQRLAEEAFLFPLFHEQTYRFAHPSVQGMRLVIGTPEVAYDELRLSNDPV